MMVRVNEPVMQTTASDDRNTFSDAGNVCMSSREATKCYCGASNCRGIIGSGKQSPLKSSRRKSAAAAAAKTKDRKKADVFSDLFVSYM